MIIAIIGNWHLKVNILLKCVLKICRYRESPTLNISKTRQKGCVVIVALCCCSFAFLVSANLRAAIALIWQPQSLKKYFNAFFKYIYINVSLSLTILRMFFYHLKLRFHIVSEFTDRISPFCPFWELVSCFINSPLLIKLKKTTYSQTIMVP